MSKRPRVTFASGVTTVTGANFLFETADNKKLLIDCGLIQGEKVAVEENRAPFPYVPQDIEALIITHAHLDHVGRIPRLVREGFRGTIYSTPETKELAELVLNDAVGILAGESAQEHLPPLYTREDVSRVFPLWKTIEYHETFSPVRGTSVLFKDAGHILGSAMIEVTTGEGEDKVVTLFGGDVGNSPAPILRDTETVGEVDYLIIESVYGDRNHEDREQRLEKFEQVIHQTLDRGGTLVIPAFSIDRTQVLLYELNNLVEAGKIPSVPVYVDSPMGIGATDVYKGSEHLFNERIRAQIQKGDDVFSFKHLQFTMSQGDSMNIDKMRGAKIILAGSGMSVGGRVIRHEENYLPDPKNTILLVGYQSAGSIGRQLAEGNKKIKIHGRTVEVNAQIETLYGYSAHKDSDHMVEFVSTASSRTKRVFVVMGEPKASMHLAQRINDELMVKALVPERNVPYEL
jgi:metallo-beta-lactamase family protein